MQRKEMPSGRLHARPRCRLVAKLRTAALSVLCASSACLSSPADAAPEKALMADRAADMVGVNTHLAFYGTVYDTHWSTVIRPRLLELGVRHIRDHATIANDPTFRSRLTDLARNGVKALLINWPAPGYGHDYVKAINQQAGFTVVEAVEPPNERDVRWEYFDFGPSWPAKMRAWMEENYPRYKSDPATASLKVLGPSFANTRDSAAIQAGVFPNAASYMDAGNLHNYSGVHPEGPLAGGWGLELPDALLRYRALAGTKPLWVTENGYKLSGYVPGHPVVTERGAAKYLPRQFLVHLQHGVRRYYIYELINEAHENFGLLNDDGTPRLQYRAVKNFIAMFKDPGAPFTTGSLDHQLTGNLTDIRRTLLQKRNGRFYLVVWQGVPSVNGTRDNAVSDIEPPPRRLTLELATKITRARVYQPTFSTRAVGSYSNANGITSIPLSVPDHLLVVELIP